MLGILVPILWSVLYLPPQVPITSAVAVSSGAAPYSVGYWNSHRHPTNSTNPLVCSVTITFDDYPSGSSSGSINWGGIIKTNGQTGSQTCSTKKQITASPSSGWTYFRWEITGEAGLDSTIVSPTNIASAGQIGTATLTADYVQLTQVSGTWEISNWPVVSTCQPVQSAGDPIYDSAYSISSAPNNFDNCLVFAGTQWGWDKVLLKAQVGVESNYNWQASNSQNDCHNGWLSYGLFEVTPCDFPWFGQMNGQLNTDLNQGDSRWGYSVWNPAYNAWAGGNVLSIDLKDVKNTFGGCTSNQYIYLTLGDYNQGLIGLQGQVTGCVINSGTKAYNYVDAILVTSYATGGAYNTLCAHISGCTDPYTGFPNS